MNRVDKYEETAGAGMNRMNNNIERMLEMMAKRQQEQRNILG